MVSRKMELDMGLVAKIYAVEIYKGLGVNWELFCNSVVGWATTGSEEIWGGAEIEDVISRNWAAGIDVIPLLSEVSGGLFGKRLIDWMPSGQILELIARLAAYSISSQMGVLFLAMHLWVGLIQNWMTWLGLLDMGLGVRYCELPEGLRGFLYLVAEWGGNEISYFGR